MPYAVAAEFSHQDTQNGHSVPDMGTDGVQIRLCSYPFLSEGESVGDSIYEEKDLLPATGGVHDPAQGHVVLFSKFSARFVFRDDLHTGGALDPLTCHSSPLCIHRNGRA